MNYSKYLTNPIFKIIKQESDKLNYPTFVVGGWVRDLLLNREKDKTDIDFVCVGSGIILAQKIASKLGNNAKFKIFKRFGTAMIQYQNEYYEFVGARKESYRADSRKPIIENGTLEDDQRRRDFTINAMAIQLNEDSYGKLIDPFNGQNDLKEKIIQTPLDPNITYIDDPLRMMRCIRFASELDFKIQEQSIKSIKKNSERLKIISQERITDELNKIILCDKPSKGFKLLLKTKLLDQFFPSLVNLNGVETIGKHSHKDNFIHTLEVLDNISKNTNNLWLRWAAILHDIAKPQTKKYDKNIGWTFHTHDFIGSKMVPKIFRNLKLPLNEKMKYVQKLVTLHLRPIVLSKDIVTDSALRRLLFDAGNDIDDLMMLCEADITTKNPKRFHQYHENFKIIREKIRTVEERDRIRNFHPPISGKKIMNYFGLKPCEKVGIIKETIKEAILEGEISNKYLDAFNLMKKKGSEMGLKPNENKL